MYGRYQTPQEAIQTVTEQEGFTHISKIGLPSQSVYLLYRVHPDMPEYRQAMIIHFDYIYGPWCAERYNDKLGTIPAEATPIAEFGL